MVPIPDTHDNHVEGSHGSRVAVTFTSAASLLPLLVDRSIRQVILLLITFLDYSFLIRRV
jgi:hypothetical protein